MKKTKKLDTVATHELQKLLPFSSQIPESG